jgi:hypothetical protein
MGNITFVFFFFLFYDFVSRETMERCSALYAEVQRSVGRLARVCERRKAQLEKHLPSPPTPPASNKENCDGVDDDDDDARIGIDNGNGNSISACRQVRRQGKCFIFDRALLALEISKKWDRTLVSFLSSGTYESRKIWTPHRDSEG